MVTAKRIVILGSGDLAIRIGAHLQHTHLPLDIVIASRQTSITAKANLIKTLFDQKPQKSITAVQLDILDQNQLNTFLQNTPADLILNAACLLSSWAFHDGQHKLGNILHNQVGFAAQLCAQIPLILALMESVYALNIKTPVVNASFPDATNPILHKLGLAPLCGIGNAGMLDRTLKAHYPQANIKLVAHHALVQKLLCSDEASSQPDYHLELDGKSYRWSELMQNVSALQRNAQLNFLTAAHAVDVVDALLDNTRSLQTSIAGPFGRPGGYPCLIQAQQLNLQAPKQIDLNDAEHLNHRAARLDGIDKIDNDGTVYYTDELQAALPQALKFLGQPLHPYEALGRFSHLKQLLYT